MELFTGFKRYRLNHERKVQNLKDQLERLRYERDRRQHFIEVAEGKGEEIEPDVRSWVTHAEEKIEEEEETVKDLEAEAKKRCFVGQCPDFKSLELLSERAEENTRAVLELIKQAESHKFDYEIDVQNLEKQAEADNKTSDEAKKVTTDLVADNKVTGEVSDLADEVAEKQKQRLIESGKQRLIETQKPIENVESERLRLIENEEKPIETQKPIENVESERQRLIETQKLIENVESEKQRLIESGKQRLIEAQKPIEIVESERQRLIETQKLIENEEKPIETQRPIENVESERLRLIETQMLIENEEKPIETQKTIENVESERQRLIETQKLIENEEKPIENVESERQRLIETQKLIENEEKPIETLKPIENVESERQRLMEIEKQRLIEKRRLSKGLLETEGYGAFKSREGILENIMEAFKEPDLKIIGVYGMSGVGKTTLVKEAARRAREESLFDEIAMATVSRNPNVKEIQGKIADALGLEFYEESVFARAMKLHQRLKKDDKSFLLILDDVWHGQRLQLEAIGIALESYQNIASEEDRGSLMQNVSENAFQKSSAVRFKILLTSTTQEVLIEMKTARMFVVQGLTDEEAMLCFEIIAGNPTKQSVDQQILTTVVTAGFPVAIIAISNAFRTYGNYFLVDALRKESKPKDQKDQKDEKLESVYSILRLSYRLLESKWRSFFQLCALLPQGSDIHVSDLLRYNWGLGLANVRTLEEAREIVNKLKDAGLLLSGDNDEVVKMHDIVRHVSIQIAAEENLMFVIEDDKRMNELLEQGKLMNCSAISLHYSDKLPPKLKFLSLKLLLLLNKNPSLKVPETFFEEINELLVLDLAGMNFPSLPSSFTSLSNLQKLCLNECKLNDIANIGELLQLNTLRIHNSDIQRLPREIGRLKLLSSLDLSNCSKLVVIPENIISGLSNLEELLMRNSFDQWGVEGNANLSELKLLNYLTTLDVHIHSAQAMPAELFSQKLDRYKILVGEVWDWYGKYEKERMLKLKLTKGLHLDPGVKLLLQKTEDLYLDGLKGVKNSVYELDKAGFPQLKNLYIQNGSEIQFIINCVEMPSCKAFPILESLFLQNLINLEKICQGKLEKESFARLKIISIKSCDRLKNLFPFSMTKMLLQLQEIEVTNCKSIEEIVIEEREKSAGPAINKTEFLQLRSLTLQLLPDLSSFCFKEKSPTIYQQELVSTRSWLLFNEKVVLPVLENLRLSSISIERIWQKTSYLSQKLTSLVVEGCGNLKHLFSPSITRNLLHLKNLLIIDCKCIREIVAPEEVEGKEEEEGEEEEEEEEEKKAEILFPKLNSLKMKNLGNLVGFCSENYSLQFPSLKLLEIENCPQLKEFMHKSLSADITTVNEKDYHFGPQALFNAKVAFPNLLKLKISHLKTVKMICHNQLLTNSFSKLEEMKVGYCNDLLNIFPSNMVGAFRGLKTLIVFHCDSLQHIFEIKALDSKDVTQLRELYIFHLPKLKHVWNEDLQGILTFSSIRIVYVRDCWSLKTLFPASVAKGLQELEDLTIDCCGLEEVVSKEEGSKQAVNKYVFPQVCSLTLCNLPDLKCFYPAAHEIEWPKLKRLKTYHCGHEKLLGIEKHESLIQKPLVLFEKVIHYLEELSLNSKEISIIGDRQFPAGLFSRIKVLQVLCYHDRSTVFPFRFLKEFNNLEKLEVICCEFKELFSNEGDACEKTPARILPQIRKLKLVTLPILSHIWGQNSQLDQVFPNLQTLEVWRCDGLISLGSPSASFQNLTTLDVWQCKEIVTLITSSAARNLLQLIEMRIRECIMLTEIVAEEKYDEKEEIIFTRLKCLELHYVPNLASFCSGKYKFQFPSLEQIVVRQCPKLKIFCQGVLSTPELHRVQQAEDDYKGFWAGDLNTTIHQLHKYWVRYCEPEYLKLHEFPELEEIWNKVPQGIMDFKRLKFLEVCNCNNLRYIFTTSIAVGLVELQHIKVKNCQVIEDIIRDVTAATKKIIFPQLISISLKSCLGLESFYLGSCALEFPNLKEITLVDCPKMVAFAYTVSEELEIEINKGGNLKMLGKGTPDVSLNPFFSDKVSLPVLKDLTIIDMGSLKRLWDDQLEMNSFFKLKHFKVHGCMKPSNIFPLNMLGRLQRLKNLEIAECASLEEIFEPESTEAEVNMKLVFPQVTYLNLSMLPQLKSFYSRMHAIEWPSLRKMDVYGCDKLEIFAAECPSSQETQEQQPLFWINKFTFPCLEELRLECSGIKKEIWHGQLPEGYFKLKVLELIKFPTGVTVLPSYFFRSLSNLENFSVSGASFNEIFPCEELSGEEKQERALAHLSRLKLSKLHELTHLWKENFKPGEIFRNMRALEVHDCGKLKILVPSLVSFENLTTLEVSRCQGLKHLIALSTAKSLVQLTRMSITYCQMIEEIVCSGDEGEEDIVFPRLKCLGLSCLPNLKSFCSGNYTFEFPLLETVTLRHCPKMKNLSRDRLSTPKLRLKYSNEVGGEGHWEGDQNTTIQLLFMERVEYRAIEYLVLSDSSKLMEIRNWNPQGTLDFKNLTFLKVYNCRNLRHTFNPSMAMDLVHLEKLEIHDCEMLEEVIITHGLPKKERMRKKIFPKLVSLMFDALPNLKRFCSGDYFEFPSLKELWIQRCPMLKTFISSSVTRNSSGQDLHTDLTPLFEEKVAFPSLEKLGIIDMGNLRKICNDQISMDLFPKLKVLKLIGLPKQSASLPSCFFLPLTKLERLVVNDASFTEIFQCGGVGRKTQAWELSDFSDLWLSKLPELTHLWKVEFQSQPEILLQNLRTIKVLECPKLKSLVLSTMCFENLTTLEISRCHGFINLLTPSTAKTMVQLQRMKITDCKMIEEIIANAGDTGGDSIIFKQLEYLRLQNLPQLTSFCSGCNHFEFPSLDEFVATECPKLSVFSKGQVSTPSLQKVCLTGEEDRPLKNQNLNTTVEGSYSEKTRNDVEGLKFVEWMLSELWRPSIQ